MTRVSLGIDLAKVPGERETTHFADSARQLNSGRPATDDDKRQQLSASCGIVNSFRRLERAEETTANLGCLRHSFQARGVLFPIRMTEVSRNRPQQSSK